MIDSPSSTEIELLARSLEFDLRHFQALYSSKRQKFEKFRTRLERYAAQEPAFTEAEKPALWAFVQKAEVELCDWKGVIAAYKEILGKLRGGLRNAA